MRVLFLCNKSPWPPREGGPMAMNMLIEGLAEAGHRVKVLAVNSFKYNISIADIPSGYRETTGIELIDVDLRLKPFDAFLSLLTGRSYHVQRFISDSFRNRVTEVLQEEKFDVIQLETLYMCPYIAAIRAFSDARIVLRAHNIEHLIWQRIAGETKNPLKKWYLGQLAGTLKKYEKKVLSEVDGILAITPTDASFLHSCIPAFLHSRIPVLDLPFGIDPDRYDGDRGTVEFPSLFSLGSMNWIPNQEGIRWFLQNVWPDVSRQFPGLTYYIAGRGMPQWMLSLNIPGVVVAGEVADARAFMASKAIMIVPLFSGSGIRVKIIEGMAAGKAIISTAMGAEGISCNHGENILIADAPCEFFEMISACVTNPALCSAIGKQARELVVNRYNARLLTGKLIAFYQQFPE